MPTTELQKTMFVKWITINPVNLDFIWDNMTTNQKNALTARIKSDLTAQVATQQSQLTSEQSDINSL